MIHAHLGRTGVRVSRLCLGVMNVGPSVGTDLSGTVMDRALDAGITFFDTFLDTANAHGRPTRATGYTDAGAAEYAVGDWLSRSHGRRDQIVLATGLHGPASPGPGRPAGDGKLSGPEIRRRCEESLRRLRTDHIDLLQISSPARDTPWEEIWQATDMLAAQGKIVYVGSSGLAGWEIAAGNEAAMRRRSLGLVSNLCDYSVLERAAETEVLPVCQSYGVGVIGRSPLLDALLDGVSAYAPAGVPEQRQVELRQVERRLERHRPRFEAFVALCESFGERPASVALAWLLAQPELTAATIRPHGVDELTAALRALEIVLGERELDTLDRIAPGPAVAVADR
ncbi:aldo/keto reductase [Protofrankia coriariae]|uniref:aldo/keto reductase n=1 Tax=Protofrankia coriariae TaxID=1562887 RepID=UPI00069A40BC|nr:aldo/keto reductase [Protofrankia coriariae]